LDEISHLCGTYREGNTLSPLLPVEELQRLDKNEGEALIMRIRSKPYITKLPDIEIYDKGSYRPIQMPQRRDINF
jgi:hypothetical protein